MKITLKRGEAQDRLRFDRLMQLYIYDFTDIVDFDLNEEGLFETTRLDSYFSDETKNPFLIFAGDVLAGFVLVSGEVFLPENTGGRCIREFFVVRKHRRSGVGKEAASQIFSMLSGKWEVRVMRENANAEKFWEIAIGEYTQGNYKKERRDSGEWLGTIFSFDSSE